MTNSYYHLENNAWQQTQGCHCPKQRKTMLDTLPRQKYHSLSSHRLHFSLLTHFPHLQLRAISRPNTSRFLPLSLCSAASHPPLEVLTITVSSHRFSAFYSTLWGQVNPSHLAYQNPKILRLTIQAWYFWGPFLNWP